MPLSTDDRDKLNKIEELKSKLFSKNYQIKMEHRDTFSRANREDIQETWDDERNFKNDSSLYKDKFIMKTSFLKKFFIFSVVFFILTLIYASYVFFAGSNVVSNENIDISIFGNNFIAGGEELSLVVGITNKNSSSLDLVNLVMEYPKSGENSDADSYSGTERNRFILDTIPSGTTKNENVKVKLFGEQGSVRVIKFSLEYRVEGSNSIFVKTKTYEVTINSTPLNVVVDAPSVINQNQSITFNIKTTLNSQNMVPKMLLKMNYPIGFQFESSIPEPSLGNNIWNLGDLAPGAENNISVTGKMVDVFDGEEKVFHIIGGSQSTNDKSVIDVVFNSLAHVVLIKKPFIEAKLFVNGMYQREYATNTKNPINAEIRWTNNLDTKVNDLEIRAKISGNALNRRTIKADQGFYDSATDIITWNKNYVSELNEVNSGDSGSVKFSLSSLSLFSATGGILSNPAINIDVSISGKQLLAGYENIELNNSDSSTVKIISDVGFATKALYYSGPFSNTGPVPPQVGKETSYTITWSLSNTANNISGGIVSSSIPSWIKFVGSFSPSDENLTYNSSTREITWNIDKINRGSGITTASRSVSFQVVFTPSLSQVNSVPVLINDSVLTGHDDFANVDIRINKGQLRISLDDPLMPSNGGIVIE